MASVVILMSGGQQESRHSGARSCASPDAQLRIGESITPTGSMDFGPAPKAASRNDAVERSCELLERKNPPRISADGFWSATNHLEQNTMVDRTGQLGFDFVFHRRPGLNWREQFELDRSGVRHSPMRNCASWLAQERAPE